MLSLSPSTPIPLASVEEEANARLSLITPVLREEIVAAREKRPPCVRGIVRRRGNAAVHCFSEAAGSIAVMDGAALNALQRGTWRPARPSDEEEAYEDLRSA